MTKRKPVEVELNHIAADDARNFDRLAAFGWGRTYAQKKGRAFEVLQSFRAHVGGTILDVGAGANAPIFTAALGPGYHALDLSESYKYSTHEDRDAIEHRVDLERGHLPFADASFDTVLCLDVLEHLDVPHSLYSELFRVAKESVIVSLPNNWPHMIWSILYGRNVTHHAGYGLGARGKPLGERHKHFFNLEEAVAFLVGAAPGEFSCAELAFRFEHGSDGLLASCPAFTRFFRLAGKAEPSDARTRFGEFGVPIWVAAKAIYVPLRLLDVAATAVLFGWGNPVRYYNFGCRQVWAVFRRTPSAA